MLERPPLDKLHDNIFSKPPEALFSAWFVLQKTVLFQRESENKYADTNSSVIEVTVLYDILQNVFTAPLAVSLVLSFHPCFQYPKQVQYDIKVGSSELLIQLIGNE